MPLFDTIPTRPSLQMWPGMMPAFRLPGRDQARAVRPDDPRLAAADRGEHAHHVERRNAFGDAHGQRQAGVGRFHARRRRANGGGTKITDAFAPVSRTRSATVLNTGQPSWVVPALAGRHAADDLVP